MGFAYLEYLALVFSGTLALGFFFKTRIPIGRALKAIFPVALFFIAWDGLAVMRGHWSFNPEFLLGVFVGNQPLEEIVFFFVIPFFYITIWEMAKARVN